MDFKQHNLTCDPFQEQADTRFFFESPPHVRAFRGMAGALEKKRLILLTGPPGCGKSLLIQCLLHKMEPASRPVQMLCAPRDHGTLADRLRRACDRKGAAESSVGSALIALREQTKAGSTGQLVLVFDQAENLPESAIGELVALIRQDDRPECSRLRVLMVGRAELAREVLEIAGDDERITRIGPLSNLDPAQVAAYIQHRWTVAGGMGPLPVSEDALQNIAERTAGNPRYINRVCAQLLAHMARDHVPAIDGEMVERVLASAGSNALRANVPKSAGNLTRGSVAMPVSSSESTRAAARPAAAIQGCTAHTIAREPADPVAPVSADKALELFSLVERLERALASAPAVISALESAMTDPKHFLKRCDAQSAALKRHQDSLSESLSGLDDTCAKAEQLQHSLAQAVDQLAGIGDASQEKISLLLDSLELGNKTRQELESTIRQHSQTSLRLETTATECERRLSETAQALTSSQERAHRTLIENLKSVHNDLLAPFGEQGEQTSRLQEVISGGLASLSNCASGQKRDVESIVNRLTREIESKLSEHHVRLTAAADQVTEKAASRIMQMIQSKQETLDGEIDRRLAAFGPTGEHTVRLDQLVERGKAAINAWGEEKARDLTDTIDTALSRFESAALAYEKRASETADKATARAAEEIKEAIGGASKKLTQSADEYLSRLRDSTDDERKQIVSDLANAEQRVRTIAENTEEANKILNTLIRNRDFAYEKRLAEVADAATARVVETIDAKCEGLEKDLAHRLAAFAPNGEETVHLSELINEGLETIRHASEDATRDVQNSVELLRKECERETAKYEAGLEKASAKINEKAVARLQRDIQATRESLNDEIDRRVASFGPTGEHTVRLAELVTRGVETITGVVERERHALEHGGIASRATVDPATGLSGGGRTHTTQRVQGVSSESSSGHESPTADALDHGIEAIRETAEERVRELTDKAVAKIVSTGDDHAQELQRTADEQIARFAEATESTHGQLTSQIQAAKQAARMVSESTQEGHSVLNELIKNRESADCQITKLKDEAEKAGWTVSQLEELHTAADPTITELRKSLQGTDEAIEKTERLIENVWSLTTTAEERARDIRQCFPPSEQIIERLATAQRRTEQTAAALDRNVIRAQDACGTLEQAVTQARSAIGEVSKIREEAVESASKATAASDSAKARREDLINQIERAGKATAEIEGAARSADETTDRLAELIDMVMGQVDRQEAAVEQCEEAIRRVDLVCEAAAEMAEQITATSEQSRQSDESFAARLEGAKRWIEEAKHIHESLATHTRTAEQVLQQQRSATETHQKAINELQQQMERDANVTRDFNERLASSKKIGEQLGNASTQATQVSEQIKGLLGKLIEKRDVYENNERALTYCLERAEALGAKLQQLQTRGDAFEHQLSGMLAEPRKIVDESKVQAGQLNTVCTAVRKVFSGLSKTSLQANRDIARFADISREANKRLGDLTEESKRASQTLRQWVDEASHAQSRLATSLARVPSIDRTHPTSALAGLSKASSQSIPDVLSSAAARRTQAPKPKNGPVQKSNIADRLGGKTDVAALIREAESVAQVME